MKRPTHTPLKQAQHLHAILPRLLEPIELYEAVVAVMTQMEQAYDEIASHYGFICQGCEESCCRTLFYHHTYAEFMLLEKGLKSLPKQDFGRVLARAVEVEVRLDRDREGSAADPPRAMCPLNRDGRCLLYAHRPMICRLHGIPHTLQRPDGHAIAGPGCHRFDLLRAEGLRAEGLRAEGFKAEGFKAEDLSSEAIGETVSSRRLDRTPHYQRLALMEQQLRSRIEAPIRLNMTLAEWLAARAGFVGDEAQLPACFSNIKDASP